MKALIIGGVAGGAGAAARLRRNDESADIVLLERGKYISFANCGLPYYLGGVIEDEAELLLHTPETFNARFGVDVRLRHEAVAVNASARTVAVRDLATGRDYEEHYDKLILSPGARAVRPPIEGLDADHVFVLRNMGDCQAIWAFMKARKPRNAVVIGAGFVGLEVAENLHRQGMNLTIIEAAANVLGPLDGDMAAEVHNHIRSKGVRLLLNTSAARLTATSVVLGGGGEVPADLVLVSAGVAPDTGFLRDSGIALGKRGEILVNEQMQTSQEHIYAVGDAVSVTHIVTGQKQVVALASPATKEARVAADAVSGLRSSYKGAQGTAIAKVFDMTVALTGLGETALARTDLPYMKVLIVAPSHAGYYPGASPLTVKVLFNRATGLLYGAQITGYEGVDKRLDVLATALRAKMTVFDLQSLELAYAPPYSSSKDPVNVAGYVAANILEKRSKVIFPEAIEAEKDSVLLLDLRNPDEFAEGNIAGSINVPLPELRARLGSLDRSKPVCVTCQAGLRGHVGAEMLRHAGFDVRNLMGGYYVYGHMLRDAEARAATKE